MPAGTTDMPNAFYLRNPDPSTVLLAVSPEATVAPGHRRPIENAGAGGENGLGTERCVTSVDTC